MKLRQLLPTGECRRQLVGDLPGQHIGIRRSPGVNITGHAAQAILRLRNPNAARPQTRRVLPENRLNMGRCSLVRAKVKVNSHRRTGRPRAP